MILFSPAGLAKNNQFPSYPKNILNIYHLNGYPGGGIKHHLQKGIYVGGNLEYQSEAGPTIGINSFYLMK